MWKRSIRAKLPSKMEVEDVKITLSCQASLKKWNLPLSQRRFRGTNDSLRNAWFVRPAWHFKHIWSSAPLKNNTVATTIYSPKTVLGHRQPGNQTRLGGTTLFSNQQSWMSRTAFLNTKGPGSISWRCMDSPKAKLVKHPSLTIGYTLTLYTTDMRGILEKKNLHFLQSNIWHPWPIPP